MRYIYMAYNYLVYIEPIEENVLKSKFADVGLVIKRVRERNGLLEVTCYYKNLEPISEQVRRFILEEMEMDLLNVVGNKVSVQLKNPQVGIKKHERRKITQAG